MHMYIDELNHLFLHAFCILQTRFKSRVYDDLLNFMYFAAKLALLHFLLYYCSVICFPRSFFFIPRNQTKQVHWLFSLRTMYHEYLLGRYSSQLWRQYRLNNYFWWNLIIMLQKCLFSPSDSCSFQNWLKTKTG